ncbi:MAG: DUF7594 domain-containing protein [Thermomicrobiales bacterium]
MAKSFRPTTGARCWLDVTMRLPTLAHGGKALVLGVLLLVAALVQPGQAPAAVPSNFTDTAIASVGAPTDLAFTPEGRVLITTQGGRLRLYSNGTLRSTPALDLSGRVCADFERGLLGVAVDPSFSSNGYVYLYYTYDWAGDSMCARNTSRSPVNRVSRFMLGSASTINPASEVILLDNMPSPNGNHNAGDLAFGNDGLLYVAIGDGGCDLDSPSNCAGQNGNARDLYRLSGKILRITKTGGVPSSNPFMGSNSDRCALTGRTTAGRVCQEIFATGLRNPFRFAFNPNESITRFYINDVGQNLWEEIDVGRKGADYGWNVREGFCANGSTSDCGAPPAGMTNPLYAYGHGSCTSITGSAFVPNGVWPENYDGAYLFGDYTCGRMWSLIDGQVSEFASGIPGPIAMTFGPHGQSQALYYTTYDGGGQVRRIAYTGQANRPPRAEIEVDKTFGPLPLTIRVDGRDSSDPDGDPLTYDWDFGDGSAHETGAQVTHTYGEREKVTATLTVRDSRGATDATTIAIDAGNTQPTPVISAPTTNKTFSVGETITLSGSATDADDGALPDSALSWQVILHHDSHTHPYLPPTNGNNITFQAPAPEDLLAATNSYLEIQLTATDSNGLAKTISQNLQPHTVDVTFATTPPGLAIEVNGVAVIAPAAVTSWQGYVLDVNAPDQTGSGSASLAWLSWSDGGAQSHAITTPATPVTYAASYQTADVPGFLPVADTRVKQAYPAQNFGTSTALQVEGGSDPDSESYLRFDVAGISGQVTSAKLWVYVYSGTNNGPAVYRTRTHWSETSMTWNNRAGRVAGPRDDKGAIPSNTWVAWDVTSWVTRNDTFSFVLVSSSTDGLSAYSREATANRPRLEIQTTGGGDDAIAPSVPQDLTAVDTAARQIGLTWSAATDNVGVTSYDVFRDGVLLTTIGAQTSYVDALVQSQTTYEYEVRARDAAGNVSELSNAITVTTAAQPTVRTFAANADALVQEARPDSRYGSSSQLKTEAGSDPDIESYVRFDLNGLSGVVQSATLRVYVPDRTDYGTSNGPAVFIANNDWTETGITWNNRPARSTTPRDDRGALTPGSWVEFDVLGYVDGNGTYTFVLATTSNDSAIFSSRNGADPPQLVIETVPGETGAASVERPPTGPAAPALASPSPTPQPTPAPSPPADPTATPDPVLPFVDDFETADLSRWTESAGVVVEQGDATSGVWAARAANAGTTSSPGAPAFARMELGRHDELYVRVRFTSRQQGDNEVSLVTLRSDDGRPIVTTFVTREGEIAYSNDAIGRVEVLEEFDPSRWHEVQVHVQRTGDQALIEIWFDGNLLHRSTEGVVPEPISEVVLGEFDARRTYDLLFDDIASDRACIGRCPSDLATPPATIDPSEPSEEPTAPPAPAPTNTPEPIPTATFEPTATPTPEPTPTPTEVPPTQTPSLETPVDEESSEDEG